MRQGVLPDHEIEALMAAGGIAAPEPLLADQIQPASLDLRLGPVAHRLRASFLPGAGATVAERLDRDLLMHTIDLRAGAVLETGCVYLAPLLESLALPGDIEGAANPKSSTGRIDVFTRVLADRASRFDFAPRGYLGPVYLEISPRTFSILVRTGDRLAQLRLRRGPPIATREMTFTVDLARSGPAGFRAKRHSRAVDVAGVGSHDPADYWEPLSARRGKLILDPGEFYILASNETVVIPLMEAAEMAPIMPELGEFRAHYAGFFDPGFGVDGSQGRAVLEVRSRDVPFVLEHGQPVGRLVFEPMASAPRTPYGRSHSHYQGQGLKLSKHFKAWEETAPRS
jgi:dCTP deaminase